MEQTKKDLYYTLPDAMGHLVEKPILKKFDDARVEVCPCKGSFSTLYRTPETRALDGKYNKGRNNNTFNFEVPKSSVLAIFENIVEKTGFFVGVNTRELEALIKGPDLDFYIEKGWVKKFLYNGQDICVPVKFY